MTVKILVVVLPAASVTVIVNVFTPPTKSTVLRKTPLTTGTGLSFILTVTPVASSIEPLISMLLAVVVSVQPVAVSVAPKAGDIVTAGGRVSMVNDQVLDQPPMLPAASTVRTRQYHTPSANAAVGV